MTRHFERLMAITAVAVLLLSTTFAFANEEKQLYENVTKTLKDESNDFNDPISKWKVRKKCNDKCLDPELKGPKWKSTGWGYYWVEKSRQVYFKKNYKVPETVVGRPVAGSKAYLEVSCEDDAEIYVNGKFAGAVHRRGEVLLSENAQPGDALNLTFRLKNKNNPGLLRSTVVRFSRLDELKNRTRDFIVKVESVSSFIEFAEDPAQWTGLLNKAAALIDLDAYAARDDAKYFASLDAADEVFKEFAPFFKDYNVYLVGYSHIDLAWLWDWAEGEDVTRDTSRTVMKLMEQYPDFVYAQTQAHGYKWMEDDYPEIFEQIKKWYKEGRWEIAGGTWSEHDSNIPSGEGFVRQFLYGKRYFREKFGKDVVIAWTPDSFGYNWNLPQILKKSGMTGFITQKINWNDTTRFPYHIFWWEGPDGSRVLTYFPVGGYGESIDGPTILRQMKRIIKKHNVKENFVIFGVGDHGGGVTRGHLERARALDENPAYPNIHYVTSEEYFKHLHELAPSPDVNFPVWNDELYLEYHRGTYTTQATTKKNNRRGEILMENAEKFITLARVGDPSLAYPSERVFDGWYWILLNHMHDILPGSGIRAVYEDADRDYAKSRRTGNAILSEGLNALAADIDTTGPGLPIVLFNPLSWRRDGVVQTPVPGLTPGAQVLDPDGAPVPCQVVLKGEDTEILFVARDVPATGYAVYHVLQAGGGDAPARTSVSIEAGKFGNDLIQVKYDVKTGLVTSLTDKRNGNRELLADKSKSNEIQVFEDWPTSNDAWNISLGAQRRLDRAGDSEIVENGPVRVTVKSTHRVGISTFHQYISIIDGVPMLYGRIEADWQERHNMAKLAFNFNITNDTVWYNIPYAAIPRKSIPKTAAERAKSEHCGQKWVDFSEADGSFGVTLVNNSKYGYDANHSTIRMSLLRSPTSPDPLADRGAHEIEYALQPHAGDWREGDAPRAGYEFNYPLLALITTPHAGDRAASHSFFSAAPENVAITVIKKAEDDNDIILRLVELEGRDSTAIVTLAFEPKSVAEVNLIEDPMQDFDPIQISGNTLTVDLGHHEIKTLKLTR